MLESIENWKKKMPDLRGSRAGLSLDNAILKDIAEGNC